MPSPASHITCSGVLLDWPTGFAAALPEEPWLVVHCKPRMEKLLARDLERAGIAGCAFFERRIRRYPGKGTQESLVPLLGGYLFVHRDRDGRDPIYATERVIRIMHVAWPRQLRQDIEDLRNLVVRASVPLESRPRLQPGTRVVIRRGPLAGIVGVVNRLAGACEVVVNIHALGHSVAARVAESDVEDATPATDTVTPAAG